MPETAKPVSVANFKGRLENDVMPSSAKRIIFYTYTLIPRHDVYPCRIRCKSDGTQPRKSAREEIFVVLGIFLSTSITFASMMRKSPVINRDGIEVIRFNVR